MFKKIVLFGILFVLVSFSAAFAANEPYVISFQGKLEGPGVTSPVDVKFELFTAATGGAPIWTETHTGVTFGSDRIINRVLGSQTAFGQQFFDNVATGLWVQITVGTTVLTSRQALTAAPYAVVAQKVYGNTSGNIVYAKSSNDNAIFASSEATGRAGVVAYGRSTGVQAVATAGNGVIGLSGASGGAGLLGMNASATGGLGVYGVAPNGYGVVGLSTNQIGVYGKGATAGGSFETTTSFNGYGVAGYGGKAAVYGSTTSGDGVYGTTTQNSNSGVMGEGARKGVSGNSIVAVKTGPMSGGLPIGGVVGTGTGAPGVTGKSSLNYGVYGESVNTYGVGGKGLVAGGSFESTSGYGVYALNNSSNSAALYAKNINTTAPVFRLESGRIIIASSGITAPDDYATVTINNAVGQVYFTENIQNVIVSCDKVIGPYSEIFATVAYDGATAPVNKIRQLCIHNVQSGRFNIYLSPPADGSTPYRNCRVHFLVLN